MIYNEATTIWEVDLFICKMFKYQKIVSSAEQCSKCDTTNPLFLGKVQSMTLKQNKQKTKIISFQYTNIVLKIDLNPLE